MKIKITQVVLIISLMFFVGSCVNQEIPSHRVVEVQPIAFDIITSHYSRVVALFVDGENWERYVPLFEQQVAKMIGSKQTSNDTLFAICNTSKDNSKVLQKYGDTLSIKYVTQIKHYSLTLSDQPDLRSAIEVDFPEFYAKLDRPDFPVSSKNQLEDQLKELRYSVVIFVNNQVQIQQTHSIHKQIYDYLELFNLKLITVKDQNTEVPRIFIYHKATKYSEYPKSAVSSLYNFTNGMNRHQLNDIVDFINIETVDLVTKLDDANYFRIFGSQLNSQLLLVYREKDQHDSQISEIRQKFQNAAKQNKQNDLKSHRVLFAEASTQFLREYFADELLTKETMKYKIIHTKTQYSTFQLRKYDYSDTKVTKQKLIDFIEDVRMKRVDASYKSEAIPNQTENSKQKIRKIVGETFISEIFERKDKSTAVLFIDSKDESYKQILESLQKFIEKYYEAFRQNLSFGIFDLAKNEHQLLTINNAPELVLFEKTNKKKPTFFKGRYTDQVLKNWINLEVKDLTIPENYGEPILPLGGPSSESSLSTNTDL